MRIRKDVKNDCLVWLYHGWIIPLSDYNGAQGCPVGRYYDGEVVWIGIVDSQGTSGSEFIGGRNEQ